MARFTVRVEFRDGHNGEGYQMLDRAMETQGFTRRIRAQDGNWYHLPTGEYRMAGRRTRAQVCRLAKAGVAHTTSEAAILVTQGRCSWHHLRGSAQ